MPTVTSHSVEEAYKTRECVKCDVPESTLAILLPSTFTKSTSDPGQEVEVILYIATWSDQVFQLSAVLTKPCYHASWEIRPQGVEGTD